MKKMSDYNDYLGQINQEIREWEASIERWADTVKESPKKSAPVSNIEKADLTEDQIKNLLYTPCVNKEHLKNWIKFFLHIDLPDKTVDFESNSNPLDMVWKIYRTAVHYDDIDPEDRHIKSLFYCSRGGFKTMCACIVELMVMIHSGRNVLHVGLIESQAKTAYNKYLQPFMDKPFIKEWAKINSILEKSTLKYRKKHINGTIDQEGENVTIEVIPCTMNKTSSPRAQLVVKDEVDKTKGEQVQAYENVYGTLTMTNDKKMAMEFDISSRDSAYGMVQDVIDNADKTGCKIYHWNQIDITERCPNSRSGTTPVPIYVKNETLIAISEEEFLELPDEDKKLYKMEWGLDGCLKNCKIFGACLGNLKNQESKCKWLKPVEITEKAIINAPSEDMAISQLLCRMPPKTGLVYSDFEKRKHIKTTSEMYEIWKGVPPECKLSTNDLIEEFKKAGLKLYVGVDAGYHHPACVMIFIDGYNRAYLVKEHAPEQVDSQELAQWLADNWKKYAALKYFVDPESPDCARSIRKQGMPCASKVDKKRQPGISTVKGFIRKPATDEPAFFVNSECKGFIYEVTHWSYRQDTSGNYTDEAEKKNDHLLDGTRYVLHTLFGKPQAKADIPHKSRPPKVLQTTDEYLDEGRKYHKSQIDPVNVAAKMGISIRPNFDDVDESYRFDPEDF